MPPSSHRGAVPGHSSGYGAERVSEDFFGAPEEMPEWAKPDPAELLEDAPTSNEPGPVRDTTPHAGAAPLVVEESAATTVQPPASVEELRASMQQILETPAPKKKPEKKKRAAKRAAQHPPGADGGEVLDDDQWRAKARAIILRQLTASDKSAKQLKDKLLEKECPEPIADEVIERFTEINLIDDEKFANTWVRSRTRTRGLARGALKHELRSKGVDDEIAQMALEQVDDQDEEERARELVRVKLRPESMGADRNKALRRLVGMLGRKGYNGSMAFRVAREEWDARFGQH